MIQGIDTVIDGLCFKIPDGLKYVKQIGMGPGKEIAVAQDPKNYNYYVCKIFAKSHMEEPDTRERFLNAVSIQKNIQHPNILSVNSVYEDDHFFYLLMDYCPNGDLYSYIVQKGKLQEEEARRIFVQIVEGLLYLHDNGVSHRDLKPENILFSPDGVPKIADFGICHSLESNVLLKTPCGSPFYAPPEVLLNKEYDGRSRDIWSLGIILFAMVTGSLPWSETCRASLFNEIINGEIIIPEDLSPKLQVLIRDMLNVNPSMRPTARQILEDPWVKSRSNLKETSLTKFRSTSCYKVSPINAYIQGAVRLRVKSKSSKGPEQKPLIVKPLGHKKK